MTCAPGVRRLPGLIIIGCLVMGSYLCKASQKKTSCYVHDGKADCSHLRLKDVPPNLPRNITSLDMSHNQLTRTPCQSLTPYTGLLHLDVSSNSLTKLDGKLCQILPLLQTLNVNHNELHVLVEEDMSHCTNLTGLHMAGNRLKLKGEPFSALQVGTVITWISSSWNHC